MGTLNQYGYITSTYAEKRAALETVFKTAFGSTLNTDAQTPQGQIIDFLSDIQNSEDKVGLSFFQQLNYHNASGALLSAIAICKGQPRKSGSKAVIDCIFTSSDQPYTIPANSVFTTTSGSLSFINQSAVNISSTEQTVQLIATDVGKTDLAANDNLSAQGYIPALTNIEIDSIADGTDDESDDNLIDRLDASDTELARNDVAAIYDKLNLLSDTTRVSVYENDTNSIVNGMPAYSIEANVVGGTNQDIATIIFNTKASGTPTSGNVLNTVYDNQGYPHTVYFNRPTLVSIWVRVRISNREGISITGNIDGMKQSTFDYINSLKIGVDVSRTPIFGIFGVGGFDISEVSLSFNGVDWVETNLQIGLREYASIANINQILVEAVQ